MKKNWGTFTLLIFLSLVGCAVGPNYKRPGMKSSTSWSTTKATQKVTSMAPINMSWWRTFNDPLLNRYIHEAATNNLDIKTAEARVRQARAAKQIAIANFYPQVDGSASAQSNQISEQGAMLGYFSNFPGVSLIKKRIFLYSLGFDAQWELDLFGKNKRTVEAQQATLEQQIEDRRKTLLSTVAEVARNYVELRGYQQQMQITLKNIQLQQKNFSLVRHRYQAGTDNNVSVAMAKSQLENTQSTLPNYIAEIRANAYQIAILLGKEPQCILKDIEQNKPLPMITKRVPIGMRAEILRQRPDVRAAERQFAASVAQIGVAVADYYPQFSLVSEMTLQSIFFNTLFNASNLAWTLGPSITFPLFHAGQIKANVESAKAVAEQNALQYQQTILSALSDAETALARYGQGVQTNQRLINAVEENQRAVTLTRKRYAEGEDDILAVITSEEALLTMESNLVTSEVNTLTNLISLYKAMGGGWEQFETKERCKRCIPIKHLPSQTIG